MRLCLATDHGVIAQECTNKGRALLIDLDMIPDNEIWKPLPFDSRYLVSSYGRIKSNVYKYERILCPSVNKSGYAHTIIGGKQYNIHRLVALTFIPTDDTSLTVDHIDGNKLNNRADNLRWCTQSENINYPIALENKRAAATAFYGKPVIQYNLQGERIARYRSMSEASRQTGTREGGISRVCLGKQKTAGGYLWKYEIK